MFSHEQLIMNSSWIVKKKRQIPDVMYVLITEVTCFESIPWCWIIRTVMVCVYIWRRIHGLTVSANVQYRYLVSASVDRTSANAWLYKKLC